MAADPNPALRAELEAALAVIEPQIRGLHDLAEIPSPADLLTEVAEQIAFREHRRSLIRGVVDALDQVIVALDLLEADGYPDLPDEMVSQQVLDELDREIADLEAAREVFEISVAARAIVGLGLPVDK